MCCKSWLSTCALMTLCLLYNKIIIHHVHVRVCGWLLSTEREKLLNSVYILSSMLCPIALRPTFLFCCAHSGGRSRRSAMTMCLRQVNASLRLRLQEVCGWLLSVEREDLLLACEPFPFLCAIFGPLAEGHALCSVLYAHLNLRTTHLTLACQHLLSFPHWPVHP